MSLSVGELIGYLTLDASKWDNEFKRAGKSVDTARGTMRVGGRAIVTDASQAGADAGKGLAKRFAETGSDAGKGIAGKFDANTAGLKDEAGKAGTEAGRRISDGVDKGTKAKDFGSVGKHIGTKIVAGIAAINIAGKVVSFLAGSFSAASDLNETVSKSQVIFGQSAAAIQAWAKNSATAFGLSKSEAIGSATAFGDMFSQLKIGLPQATDMSKAMVQLAADQASFSNADITDVLDAQQAAFRGEYDSLQRFIPNINAARVEQEALNQTHKKSAKDLTAAEKALATYSIMMKDSARAQGDFARTSNGAANQQRIAKAQLEDLQASLGRAFLPILITVTKFFNTQVIPALRAFGGWVKNNADTLKTIAMIITPMIAAFVAYSAAVKVVTIVTKAWQVAQMLLNGTMALNPIALVIAAVIGLAAAIMILWQRSETFRSIVIGAWNAVRDTTVAVWNFIKDFFVQWWPIIIGIFFGGLGLLVGVIIKYHDQIWGAIKVAWDKVTGFFKGLPGIFRGIFVGAFNAVREQIDRIVSAVRGLPGRIGAFIGSLSSKGKELGSAFVRGLKNGITSLAGFAGDVADAISGAVKGAWNAVAGRVNGWIPNDLGWGPFKIDIPDNPIPTFAKGAVVDGATLGVFGEAGREWVLPDDMLRKAVSDAVMAGRSMGGDGASSEEMARAVAGAVGSALANARWRVDGEGFARIVNSQNVQLARR